MQSQTATDRHIDSLQKPHASCGSQVHRCDVVFFFGDILHCLLQTCLQALPGCSLLACIAGNTST